MSTDAPFHLDPDSSAFYRRLDEHTFAPTLHAQGAWRDDEQHMAPVSGILTHAIDLHEPRDGLQLSRISFDILGMIPARPFTIEVATTRPGRTIELVEATMVVDGRAVVRANAWRLATSDTSQVAAVELDPMPEPEQFPQWDGMKVWNGGYIAALQCRADPLRRPGKTRTWLRSGSALLEDEACSPSADLIRVVDTANGIGVRVSPLEWAFPNIDLTIHLFREPIPGWVGFDTRVSFGPDGVGLTSSTLHDEQGPVGRAEQILTVRKLPTA